MSSADQKQDLDRQLERLHSYAIAQGYAVSKMVTEVAAQRLRRDDRLGTLEKGKLADVIVVATDPLADICAQERCENLVLVMQDGEVRRNLRGAQP